jgi:hypothetical protein
MNKNRIFGVLAIAAIVGVGAYIYTSSNPITPSVATAPQVEAEQAQESTKEVDLEPVATALPASTKQESDHPPSPPKEPLKSQPPKSLEDSDKAVKKGAKQLSQQLVAWLTPEEQIRKWVLLVNSFGQGSMPIKNLPLNFPSKPFQVATADGHKRLSASNYTRGEALVNTLLSVDVDLLFRYYSAWSPLLETAYAELGQGGSFEQTLLGALNQIIAIDPDAAISAKLEQPSVFYQYADPELENASDLEKFFWRLGPDNTRNFQQLSEQLKLKIESNLVNQDGGQKSS